MIRFFQISDTHLGAEMNRKPALSSCPGERFFRQMEGVIEKAIESKIDFLIHTGDLFDRSNPPDYVRDKAFSLLERCVEARIPVYLLPGNHEKSWIPRSIFNVNHGIHLIFEPDVIQFHGNGDDLFLIGIPFIRKNSREGFKNALKILLEKTTPERSIIFHHQFIDGARVGPRNYRFRKGPDVLAKEDLPANVLAILGGHVHRHQQLYHPLNRGLPIVYCGSLDRISFAERKEPKGYLDVKVLKSDISVEFVPVTPRKMMEKILVVTDRNIRQRCESLTKKYTGLTEQGYINLKIRGKIQDPLPLYSEYGKMVQTLHSAFESVRINTKELRIADEFHLPESFFLRPKLNVRKYKSSLFEVDRKKSVDLPESPGVYIFKSSSRKILYIGKSKHLRKRVRSHFYTSLEDKPWLAEVARIQYFECGSELEAFYLESQLIKKFKPIHNRQLLKYNEYAFLQYSPNRKKPFSVVKEIGDKQSFYWGPFSSAFHLSRAVEILLQSDICVSAMVEKTISLFSVIKSVEPLYLKDLLDEPETYEDEILSLAGAEFQENDYNEIRSFLYALKRLHYISKLNGVIFLPSREGKEYSAWFIIYQGRLVGFWNIPVNTTRFNDAKSKALKLHEKIDKVHCKKTDSLFSPPLYKKELDEVFITYRWIKYSQNPHFFPIEEVKSLTGKKLIKRITDEVEDSHYAEKKP